MTDSKKLDKLIRLSGLSYRYIAQKLNITYCALRHKIDNLTEFKSSEMKVLCELLNITTFDEFKSIFFVNEVDLKSTN